MLSRGKYRIGGEVQCGSVMSMGALDISRQ